MHRLQIPLRTKEMRSVSSDRPASLALVPEVGHALSEWIKKNPHSKGVLIGGLALSLYAKPRYTEGVDLLFLAESDIPDEVEGFRRARGHAFEEKKFQVEVEVNTASQINLPENIAQKVFDTAHSVNGLRIASVEALVVMKLFGSLTPKRKHKDLGDIQRILEEHPDVSIDDWHLPVILRKEFDTLKYLYAIGREEDDNGN